MKTGSTSSPRAVFKANMLAAIILMSVGSSHLLAQPVATQKENSIKEDANEFLPASICRIWHGWTSLQLADELESVLTKIAIPGFEKNKPNGYRGIQVLRRTVGSEVEFTTIMWFDSIEAVKNFAGNDYEKSHIDDNVAPLLLRYDLTATHIEVKYSTYQPGDF